MTIPRATEYTPASCWPASVRALAARALLDGHVGVVLQHHVAILVEVQQRDGGELVRDAARRRHFRVQTDRVHQALDRRVVRRPHLLQHSKTYMKMMLSNVISYINTGYILVSLEVLAWVLVCVLF